LPAGFFDHPDMMMTATDPAILGPGLLGGSIAMALRHLHPGSNVRIWGRRKEAVDFIGKNEIAAVASTDLAEVVGGADLVILCVPVGAMGELASRLREHLAPGAIVTDVGSVKLPVLETIGPILGNRFVGSHPMAGSEKFGIGAARADLFRGAVSIVTPTAASCPEAVGRVRAFWEGLGSEVRELSPEEHDRTVALVSHLPHLIAAALVDFVCLENRDALNFCGAGFRDTTRVAAGPAKMWTEILLENREAMRAALRSFGRHLAAVEPHFDDPDALDAFLSRAAEQRDSVSVRRNRSSWPTGK
jgi:prephenate dehydrogenase